MPRQVEIICGIGGRVIESGVFDRFLQDLKALQFFFPPDGALVPNGIFLDLQSFMVIYFQ